MGSAGFAVPCLDMLMQQNESIVQVITQPDKPAGRGKKLTACPVAQFAREHNLPLFQPARIRTPDVLAHFSELKPDIIIVVAYGKILPKTILELPSKGCINVHGSLLPKYRGAAPIQWAIRNGEKQTGITTMFLSEEMDAGNILHMCETPIDELESAGMLHDRLSILGADLLKHTLSEIKSNNAHSIPQNHDKATFAPILKKTDGRIDWDDTAASIYNLIRGFNPWPGAYTYIDQKRFRIHEATYIELSHNDVPGTIHIEGNSLGIYCTNGIIYPIDVQLEGKQKMSIVDFLNGTRIHSERISHDTK